MMRGAFAAFVAVFAWGKSSAIFSKNMFDNTLCPAQPEIYEI